jgi:hypothetical protein
MPRSPTWSLPLQVPRPKLCAFLISHNKFAQCPNKANVPKSPFATTSASHWNISSGRETTVSRFILTVEGRPAPTRTEPCQRCMWVCAVWRPIREVYFWALRLNKQISARNTGITCFLRHIYDSLSTAAVRTTSFINGHISSWTHAPFCRMRRQNVELQVIWVQDADDWPACRSSYLTWEVSPSVHYTGQRMGSTGRKETKNRSTSLCPDDCLLCWCAVCSGRRLPTFQWCFRWSTWLQRQQAPQRCW